MEGYLMVLSIGFLILFLISTFNTARTFRRERLLRPQSLILTGFLTMVIYTTYILILGVPADLALALALAAGAVVGWLWARVTKVGITAQGVAGTGTLGGFLIWALVMAGLQLANLVLGFSPGALILLGGFQTAVLFGYNLILARRCQVAKGGAAVAA